VMLQGFAGIEGGIKEVEDIEGDVAGICRD
jgi:hypothetical protein